jgi:hypothetical protein
MPGVSRWKGGRHDITFLEETPQSELLQKEIHPASVPP